MTSPAVESERDDPRIVVTRSGRLAAYLVISGACLVAALALGRPEPVALAIPLLLTVAVGLASSRHPELAIDAALDRTRALEGEEIELRVVVTARRPVSHLELRVVVPPQLEIVDAPLRQRRGIRAGDAGEWRWRLRCRAWSGHLSVRLETAARDPLGLFRYRLQPARELPLRVYPAPDQVRRVIGAIDTGLWSGNERSRLRGDGIEFADVRPFVPGDLQRRINWRVTARRGTPHVNDMHPERNTEVVLFLDTFVSLRNEGTTTLDLTVRGALALARAYLRRRDRVGLVSFGGTLRWLRPETGERQLYRILDALIDTEIVLSHAWKGLNVLPPRTLPPRSLVIALSPLLDARMTAALLDLRGRGHDLAVVELSPLPFVAAGASPTEQLAHRIWGMERGAFTAELAAHGVALGRWELGQPLAVPLAEQVAWRAHASAHRR